MSPPATAHHAVTISRAQREPANVLAFAQWEMVSSHKETMVRKEEEGSSSSSCPLLYLSGYARLHNVANLPSFRRSQMSLHGVVPAMRELGTPPGCPWCPLRAHPLAGTCPLLSATTQHTTEEAAISPERYIKIIKESLEVTPRASAPNQILQILQILPIEPIPK